MSVRHLDAIRDALRAAGADALGAEIAAWSDGEGPDAAIASVLDGIGRCLVEPDLPTGVSFALQAARPGLDLASA